MKIINTNSLGARIVSGFLSIMMMASACPISAFASYDEEDPLFITEEITIDENGNIIVVEPSDKDNNNDSSTSSDNNSKDDASNEDAEKPIYKVELSEKTTVFVNDALKINATVTTNTDNKYSLKWVVPDGINMENVTDTCTKFTFTVAGDFTIECKMFVDDVEVSKDSIVVTVKEKLPVIVFDHYFTEIDPSLIETTELMITANDSTIFTKNTNVLSNFGNAYIVSFDSVEEARYAYSYYVDKVDNITDLSKVISIATTDNSTDVADLTNINEGKDALSNLNEIDIKDYTGYIAIIDTGANADVNFSVVGDDTTDTDGHGTLMYNLIKAANPNAKVMSIKVFNGSTTDAASVYAGIMLAIESKVSVINLSFVGSDVAKNAIVKEAIQAALDANITVIGAAGNYNASATKFIPGCIDDVVVIGAANEDGTKYITSNFDADYYVVANSSSEATAIYTGLYTANKLDDERIYAGIVDKPEIPETPDVPDNHMAKLLAEALGTYFWMNEDGSYSVAIPEHNDFITQKDWECDKETIIDGDNAVAKTELDGLVTGTTYTGSCKFTFDETKNPDGTFKYAGEGTASNFSGTHKFATIMSGKSMYCSCDKYWGEDPNNDLTHSSAAEFLTNENNPLYYQATVKSKATENNLPVVTFEVVFSTDPGDFGELEWINYTNVYSWSVSEPTYKKTGPNASGYYTYNIECDYTLTITSTEPGVGTSITDTVEKSISLHQSVPQTSGVTQAINEAKGSTKDTVRDLIIEDINKFTKDFAGVTATLVTVPEDLGSSGSVSQSYAKTTEKQRYRGRAIVYSKEDNVKLTVTKKSSTDSKYTDILNSSDAYTLVGATISIYEDSNCRTLAKDKDGNNCTFKVSSASSTSKTFTLPGSYVGKTLYAKETKAGYGYRLDSTVRSLVVSSTATNKFTITNDPLYDPMKWAITKMEDTTGSSGSNLQGDISFIGAEYTVKHYKIDTNGNKTNTLENTWVYKTDNNGQVFFDDPSYCISTNKPPLAPQDSTKYTWPIGYYEITETVTSHSGNKNLGAKVNNQTFVFTNIPVQGGSSTATTKVLYAPDGVTVVLRQNPNGSEYRNSNYYIELPNGQQVLGTNASGIYHLEPTTWLPLGLYKVDANLVNAGFDNNHILKVPEGDASYAGAKYQLFVSSSKDSNFFTAGANNQVNSGELTLGNAVTKVNWTDGAGNIGTTTVGKLYPVLYNGQPVIITTDANGIAKTSIKFPYADDYRFVEIAAPKGYRISSKVLKVQDNWTTNDAGTDEVDTYYIDDKLYNTATIKESNDSPQGRTHEDIFYYGITGAKTDEYNSISQGNASLNGIKFVVINRSANRIVLNDENVTLDTQYVTYTDKKEIEPGQVVAILTTHTVDGVDGVFRMNGLPYGSYQVAELNRQATIAVGDVYDNSTKLGSSILAHTGKYLWEENLSPVFKLNGNTNNYVYNLSTHANYNPNNKPFVDGFEAYKVDKEYSTGAMGNGSLNGIKFAVVNTSTGSVKVQSEYVNMLPQIDIDNIDYKNNTSIGTGKVVAILTTHTGGSSNREGYFNMFGLPYGTYTVYELRSDATIAVGDTYAGSNKLGTSIYANDAYYFDPNAVNYTLTDSTHECTPDAAFGRHSVNWDDTNNEYIDNITRDGFFFFKRDKIFSDIADHPQGDATFNGIRYAVVNRCQGNITMFDIYNTIDPTYCEIVDGKVIAPGQVAAILTSHQKDLLEGYVAIMGLPYGKYDVYELRSDATIAIGDTYDNSNKLGTSIYANTIASSRNGKPSMLWHNNTVFEYDLTDTGSHVTTRYNSDEIHDTDDNNNSTWINETVYGSLKIVKHDRETGQTGVNGNQGFNTFEGIKFAIVNVSSKGIQYPYNSTLANDYYSPGQVIEVVTLDATGTAKLDYLPYGTYNVYELKMDSTIIPHDYYGAAKANPAKFGTDYRANEWYCWNESLDNVQITNRDLKTIEVNYIVNGQEGETIRQPNEQNVHDFYDLPIRGDFETIKVDIDGRRMKYIPFLVSLVATDANGTPIKDANGNYQVIEEHIIITNDKGELNTQDFVARPKTPDNVNKLDGLYSGANFTGTLAQLQNGATQNIWFGTINEYNTANQYVTDKRGSLLAGTYILQELCLTEDRFGADLSTERYNMVSSTIVIEHDNQVVSPSQSVIINIPVYIKSQALDVMSNSNAFVPNTNSVFQDTIEFDNVGIAQDHGFTTAIYRVKADGTKELLYEDPAVIPIPSAQLKALCGGNMHDAKFSYDTATGNWSLISKNTNATSTFNTVLDFSIVTTTKLDTSMCKPGEHVAFTVTLFKSAGADGWAFMHNHNKNLAEETQKLNIVNIETEATNKTSGDRLGTVGGYSYVDGHKDFALIKTDAEGNIIGYTIIDDKIKYSGFANNHNYRLYADLLDDAGNVVKDIYGNDCTLPYLLNIYSTDSVSTLTQGTDIVDRNGKIIEKNIIVPRNGSFSFSDLGLNGWIVPNGTNAHVVVTLVGSNGKILAEHNANFEEASENLKWMNIKTTAMNADGGRDILPSGKSWDSQGNVQYNTVILRDKIDYTNLLRPVNARVDGYVYAIVYNEDGTINHELTGKEVVAHSTKNITLTNTAGSFEMQYTVDSGKYEGRDLVITERVYMNVDHRYVLNANNELVREDGNFEALIALHNDLEDKNQTISIPKIETDLINQFNGNDYKVVSPHYADVTINDVVKYANLKPGTPWTVTATLMNQTTGEKVLDADGNPVTATVTFTPTTENGEVIVPITFKQAFVGLDWEYNPSWVCFEDLKHGTSGSNGVTYAVHNNINDERQTVHVPTFRTTISSNNTDRPKQIIAAPNQKVTDTVELKNIGLETILDANGTITGFVPAKFTLKIAAVDAETGEPILKNGKPVVATKVITVDGTKGGATLVKNDGETDWTLVQFGTNANPIVETIDLTLDATNLGGKTVVFHETLYYGDTATAGAEVLVEDTFTHVEQMVTVPVIGTTAIDPETATSTVVIKRVDTNGDGVIDTNDSYDTNGDGMVDVNDISHRAIIDTIKMTKITPNNNYKITTKLVYKDTGKAVKTADGKEFTLVTSYKSPATTPATVNGNDLVCEHCNNIYAVDDEFTINIDLTKLEDIAGKTIVVYEYMTLNDATYAIHEDINDANQTVQIPKIDTEFLDTTTGLHIVPLDTNAEVIDTVSYVNLRGGERYIMKCTLMDKITKKPMKDNAGNVITKNVTFTADASGSGTVEVKFVLDKELLHKFETLVDNNNDHKVDDVTTIHGTELVAYEECWMANQNSLVAVHSDINDVDQTILVPRIFTHLVDTVIGNHVTALNKTEVITDTVTYSSLQPGKTYTMTGKLINVDTKQPVLDKDNKEITSSKTFVADVDGAGEVVLEFIVDTTYLKGTHVVAFEDCYYNNIRVATHSSIDDEWQWMYIPELGTALVDKQTTIKTTTFGTNVTVVDTVAYTKLLPGVYYEISGVLMDKATGRPVLDSNNKEYRSSVIFMPSTANGTVDIEFNIDTNYLEGKTLVAFEECRYIGTDKTATPKEIVIEHEDINDVEQTIYIPKIRTTAYNNNTNVQAGVISENATINDVISYENLIIGTKYRVVGKLVNKATGEYILDANGNAVTASTEFVPTTVNGQVEVVFTFDSRALRGETVVVFEDVYYRDTMVATHADITDKNQTIYFPEIWTNAIDDVTLDHVVDADEDIAFTDTVTYKNLVPGITYVVEGILMNKLTDRPVIDANGETITASTTFIPTSANGTVEVNFTVDAGSVKDVTGVVFEHLYTNNYKVDSHVDINDVDQTLYFPKFKTSAKDNVTLDNVAAAGSTTTIVDTITYTNLLPGKEYTAIAHIVVKNDDGTGYYLLDANELEVIGTTKFTPTTPNGTVDVSITFDSSELEGKIIVVFEDIYLNGDVHVGKHTDITDGIQTVYFPKITTNAVDSSTDKNIGLVRTDIEIVDTVTYTSLLVGREYTINGILMDKSTGEPYLDDNGALVTSTATFTATTVDGTIDLVFKFSGVNLEGKSVVVFEDLFYENIKLTTHSDINDENQTVHFPEVRTTALDGETLDHVADADETVTITDTVEYKNLIPGLKYIVRGTLIDKATGKVMIFNNSKPAKSEVSFEPTEANGSVDVKFTINPQEFKNSTIVVYEEILIDDVIVGEHKDISDDKQTIYLPAFGTSAKDNDTNDNVSNADSETTIIDTIEYTNLLPNKEYSITTSVVVKNDDGTGVYLVDKNNRVVTNTTKFVPTAANGTVDVEITFDSSLLGGKTIVIFEDIYLDRVHVGMHADINDEAQTIHFPKITTVAIDNASKQHMGLYRDEVVIVDTISYENLPAGKEYTINGILMNKNTENIYLDDNGEKVTSEVKFTADTTDGEVPMTFEFSGNNLAANSVVAFEDVYYNGSIVATHTDITDENQTVHFPEIKTTALDGKTFDHIADADEDVEITDTVIYRNLIPGLTYLVEGTLMNKTDGTAIVDANGNAITSSVTFVPKTADGTVDVKFSVKAGMLKDKTVVVYENVFNENVLIGVHSDINDAEQTVYFPKFMTSAKDSESMSNVSMADDSITIIDTVSYTNLLPGKEYTVIAHAVIKNADGTGTYLLDKDGNEVTATAKFIPTFSNGTVDVEIMFNGADLGGKTVVIYEDVYFNEIHIGMHADINDENQTIYIPKIGTTAVDDSTDKHIGLANDNVTIVDTVSYENLVIGNEYTVKGILMDKSTGKAYLDDNGNEVTAITTFTAETVNGEVLVTFTFSGVNLTNNSVVVFEDIYFNDTLIAVHADINDDDQTVHFPEIKTTAKDSITLDHVADADTTVELIDTVEYKNLIPGFKYTVRGTLMNKTTGEVMTLEDGIPAVSEVTFEPTESEGTVDVKFTIKPMQFKDYTVVVFEEVFIDGIVIGEHTDIADDNQTVYFPEFGTTAIDKDTGSNIAMADSQTTIVDTIKYTNLLPGKEYRVVTRAVIKHADGTFDYLVDNEGNVITTTTTFTPEEANGSIDVEITFDSSMLEGKTIVMFEDVYLGEIHVGMHADINDEDQTVYFPEVGTIAKDKADNDQILDGTSTTLQTIVDTVEYTNLVVGKEYSIKTMLAIAGSEYVKDGETLYDYVRDADGNIIIVEQKFTPTSETGETFVSGSIDVEISFDASKYAGRTVVVFEDIYYGEDRIATHSDINDENQSLRISLLLHVEAAKKDAQNNSYMLEGAEITIYEDAECTIIAKDINGKDCIGVTDENGKVNFTIVTYDVNTVLYAKETKAPRGYLVNEDVFEVRPTTDRESAGKCLIEIQILDMIIVIPPNTGDDFPVVPVVLFASLGLVCIGAFFLIMPKKKNNADTDDTDEIDTAEDDVANEIEESVTSISLDDIDNIDSQ